MFTFKEIFDLFVNEKRRNSVYKKLVYIIISIFSLWGKNQKKKKKKNKEIVLRISGILVWMNPRGYNQNLQDPLWFG